MSTNPIRRSCPVLPQAAFWRILLQGSVSLSQGTSSMGLVTAINRGPLPGRRTFIHKSCGLLRWCWCCRGMCVGVRRRCGSTPPFSIYPYTCTVSSSKWQSNRLNTFGVPSAKHELDMETTCICIHVTAGSMSPSQPSAITKRLLFSFSRELITSLLY